MHPKKVQSFYTILRILSFIKITKQTNYEIEL